jgi:hypothetical protein
MMPLFAAIEVSPTIWVEVIVLAVIAAALAYAVLELWPKAFYPQVFAVLLPFVAIAGLAILWSPAAAITLVLFILFVTGAARSLS